MSEEEQTQELILHGYRFEKLIGEGTYSKAFKVFSFQYGKYFCAKMTEVDDSFFDESGNPRDPELLALLNLDHPNVIKVYNYFRQDSFFFLILELCECGTLNDRLQNKIPLDFMSTKTIMKEVVSALVVCHDLKIAHRDIKPSNIFIDSRGHVKVADFGLSEILATHNAKVCVACGSPSYAAPEIYGDIAYDPFKADVWSLGVTFYEMIFGFLPWPDEITMNGPYRPPLRFPNNTPPELVLLIQKMLSINPDERPTMEMIAKSPILADREQHPNKRTDLSIRSTISLRNVTREATQPPNSKLVMSISAASRLKTFHAQTDRTKRNINRISLGKPYTFIDS